MARRIAQQRNPAPVEPAVSDSSVAGGRYSIETRLGRGGAASVFLAVETVTGRRVAVKRLIQRANPRLVSLFELEYHTLAGIKHPNIVEVYDYGTDVDGPYYVMELLEGADLSSRPTPDWREAARIGIEVASALAVLHARRLVHRDVSARNVWCLEGGGFKLIDFGALASFGTCREVVGTPPHVAPETLAGRALDQRTDLYALGALLYWLLTGTHAYPARTLRELPELWSLPAVSVLDQLERGRGQASDVPRELDALVMALLSENPLARPGTTGEVIDRLSAVLGLAPRSRGAIADIGLEQPSLTGRDRERKEFRRQLEQVQRGTGQATVFAARAGNGRTRVLMELAVDARIFGAHVVHLSATSCVGAHGVAEAIVERLLSGLPDVALPAAQQHAPVLGHLSRDMEQRLGVPLQAMPPVAGEARANIHEALSAFVERVASQRMLVILIDDVESADESSLAWLAAFASAISGRKVLLGVGLCEGEEQSRLAIKALRHHAQRVALRSLSPADTHKLLASLFGEVPRLMRLSERLYRVTQGVPGRLVELARHLVREGIISNVEGTWVLPQELPDDQLVLDRSGRVQALVGRLGADAQRLGAALSVRQGALPIELCKALSDLPPRQLFSALEELSREGVLASNSLGYYIEDDLVRSSLRKLLSEADAKRVHRRLGTFLAEQPHASDAELLIAHVHSMEGGDLTHAPHQIARIALELGQRDPESAAQSAPALERALALFRATTRPEDRFVVVLATLAEAGFYADRRLSAQYGEAALAALAGVLKVGLMRKLRPWLGAKLSLIVSLILAGLRLRLRPLFGAPTLREAIQLYFHCLASFSGVHTICVDPQAVLRCAGLSEPFTCLGKHHAATFVHEFNQSLAMTVQDRCAEARSRWQATIAQLENPAKLRGVPEQLRLRYLAGALYAYGVLECWRDSPVALSIADRLESLGMKLYHMSADQLRSVYYANQGNRELYERYRSQAELHAIQRGTAWQIETWAPGAAITAHMRTHDAMGLKEDQEQLAQLEKRIPSLALISVRCRGAFLFLRRRLEQALPILEQCRHEQPLGVVGWARAHGVLAACLNGLERHEDAKRVCLQTLAKLSVEDLEFPAMNLNLQIELAHAEAGLGHLELAAPQLDALLQKHEAGNGPLTLGALHEARARVALLSRDKEACEHHAREMEKRYLATEIASLVACCEAFAREQRRAFQGVQHKGDSDDSGAQGTSVSLGSAELSRALSDTSGSFRVRAERALSALAEGLGDAPSALYVAHEGTVRLAAFQGSGEPAFELQQWVEERIHMAHNDEATQTDFGDGPMADPDVFVHAGVRNRLFLLIAYIDDQVTPVGAVTFEEPEALRHLVPPAILQTVALWIHRSLTNPSAVSSLHGRSLLPD